MPHVPASPFVFDKTIVVPVVDMYATLSFCLGDALGLSVYDTCNHTLIGTAVSVHVQQLIQL